MRPHIAAIYAFARIADDFADEGDRIGRRRGSRCSTTGASGSHAAVGRHDRGRRLRRRRRSSSRSATRSAASSSTSQLFDDLLSAFRQDVRDQALRDVGRPARLLPAIGQSGRPPRAARSPATATTGSTRGRTRSARRCSSTNFWQDLERRLAARAALYVPLRARARRRRRRARSRSPPDVAGVARGARATSRRGRARCFDAGRPVADARARATALGTARDVARRHAHPRSARARAASTCFARRPTLGWRDVGCRSRWRALAWSRPATHDAQDQLLLLVSRRCRAPKRRAITAVFDFCRAVDDASISSRIRHARRRRSTRWRARSRARVRAAARRETPQGRALQPFVEPFHLPRAQFDALIDGVAMDATPRRYATFADLEPYCHRVASSVGLICAEIFGYREPAVLDYARDLGVALQLTNILRDVARGLPARPPLPAARRSRRDSAAPKPTSRAKSSSARPRRADRRTSAPLLEHQAARARVFFARAVARAAASRTRRGSSPPRSCARSTSSCCAGSKRRTSTCSRRVIRVPRPAQAALALRDLVARSGAARAWTPVRRRRRDRRRFRRTERRRSSRRRRPARRRRRSRRRGWAAARRRSPIARPASASTTASTCCSAAIARPTRFSSASAPRTLAPLAAAPDADDGGRDGRDGRR